MNDYVLDERIEQALRTTHQTLARRGELLTPERLQQSFNIFLAHFGPDKLNNLDGEPLLEAMHTHGNQDSLVYWLEFKNDDEFPGPALGSIAGGSAHKFGMFRRKETGQWVTGGPQSEVAVTVAQAVEIARKHRDQLLAGVTLLEKLPSQASDQDYVVLQEQMNEQAPKVSRVAWGHKYFSLLFPEKLDDFHNERYQRYNLIKLLRKPPDKEGLYTCAGRFVRLAKQFGWPMNQFTAVLNERHGSPSGYWRIGTRLGETDSIWKRMRDGGYVAIGWEAVGDLASFANAEDPKEEIRKKLEQHYPSDPKMLSRKAGEIRNFLIKIEKGNVVLAADGQRILGIGKVTGPYQFESTDPQGAPHRRPVEWISTEEWSLPQNEGKLTTVYPIAKYEDNLLEIERRILDGRKLPVTKPASLATGRTLRLEGIPGRVQSILERKGQAILYGPPGTGKTYWARRTGQDIVSLTVFGHLFAELSSGEKALVEGSESKPGLVRSCTFHPAYGYEDFLEGYRPQESQANQLVFKCRDGIFKALCEDASKAPTQKFCLLIDEINRGDIPRIFGELLTLLEKDKRGHPLMLPLSGSKFTVPPNVYVIGTMNTADRSIALLDTALRRRFGFVELMPDPMVLAGASVAGTLPLGPWLGSLNDRIRTHCGRDARNLQIGHAYLLEEGRPITDFTRFTQVLAEDIIPLIEEYCYEDYAALTQILGPGLVDGNRQRIRVELLSSSRRDDLLQALLTPEIVTSSEAVLPPPTPEESEEQTAQEDNQQ